MEYEDENINITLSARSDSATSLIATSETETRATDESMGLSYGAPLVQKASLCPVPTEHMYTLITRQDITVPSALVNLPS